MVSRWIPRSYNNTFDKPEDNEFLDLEKTTGKEGKYNVLIQELLTIINLERDFINAYVLTSDVIKCCKILDSIRIYASPLVPFSFRQANAAKMEAIKTLVYAPANDSLGGNKKRLSQNNEALKLMIDLWEYIRLGLQVKGYITQKPGNPTEAIRG